MKNTTLKLLNDAVFETLEDRRLMSAATLLPAVLNNGVLNVTGSQIAANRVMIDLASNHSQLTVDVSGQRSEFPIAQVKQLNITTGSGSDYIYINPHITVPTEINDGDGNDIVRGSGGDCTIVSGNGDDIINAEGTNDAIQVGSGNDILMGNKNSNTLIAGNGNDYLVSLGLADHMTAGNGNDTFIAGNGHDTITAGTGHDVMTGGLGNSYLYGKSTGGTSGASTGSGSKSSGGSGSTTSTSSSGSSTSTNSSSGSSSSTGGSTAKAGGSSTGVSNSSTGSSSSSTDGSNGGDTTTPTTPVDPVITLAPVTPVTTPGTQAPSAVITTLSGPRTTGMAVNVNGLSSIVGTGTSITSNYAWNFGDSGSEFNELTGFNAAHVYDKPGNFTITLTVTNEAGLVSKTSQQVTITASARNQIYVDSVNGSDSNRGTANAPLQTLAAAFADIGDNTEILLCAGNTFYTGASLHICNTNVLIGRYGTGANPVIMRTIGNGLSTISSFGGTNGLTIQDITFNSPYPAANQSDAHHKIGVGGVFAGGQNVTVRDCTFLNIDDAINENANPTGVLVQSNSAPLMTGLRGYMVWGQGAQDTIVGNYAANTNVEHIVRCVGVNGLNVQDNNFTNHDGKGCIEVHVGENDWIVGNSVTDGDIRVGPLGLWGEAASDATTNCVIEDNQLTGTFIFVQSGTHHAMIANNVINNTAGQAIVVDGVDAQGRTSQDITIVHNTGIDTGTQGNFIEVLGYTNGMVMDNNLWIAPNLQLGAYSAAPVRVTSGYMGDFTQITGNVWPSPVTIGTYAAGGINYVGTSPMGNGYVTPAQWNEQSNVGKDIFENVTLNGLYEVSIDSQLAGAAIKIAA